MADLEQRVAMLERELTALKARVTTMDEDVSNIPDLIKAERRFTNSQIVRLAHDVAALPRGARRARNGARGGVGPHRLNARATRNPIL